MIERPGEGPLVPQWDNSANFPITPTEPTSERRTYVSPDPFGSSWHCTGVLQKNLRLHGSEHDLPAGVTPDDNTTDAEGKWRYGFCTTCGKRTVWKAI